MPTKTGDVELKRIYVLGRLPGSRLGARLIATALEAAKAAGAPRRLLGVFSKNERALNFYARQGFTQAGVRGFRVGARVCDDVVLARPL